MLAKLTPDNKFIIIEGLSQIEKANIKGYFTKNIPNWFIIKRKNPYANIESSFINDYNMIPSGLWMELVCACKKFNYSLAFSEDFNCRVRNCDFEENFFNNYFKQLFVNNIKNIEIAEHQFKAVFNILSYKQCCIEVSTGGGKTMIAYMLFKFLIDNNIAKRVLYVTPSTPLTVQSAKKFILYDKENQITTDWTYSEIHSDAKKKKEYNDTIIFGNYQSLCKKKKEFFESFDCVVIDECAHAKADSIKNILKKCSNAKYKVGVTGTFPKKGTYESFIIQSYIGPLIYKYSSYELIKDTEFATPVHVYGMLLDYLTDEQKEMLHKNRHNVTQYNVEYGSTILNMEKEVARKSELRFKFICDMAKRTTKNTLILFGDIQNGYGKKIYQHIKEYSDKSVFYVDGTISSEYRENAKRSMEEDHTGNTIIVASMGTFGEGIDIGNLWNIFLVETTKSDNNLGQILGRGMRYYEGKEKTILIDFGDDFRYGTDKKRNNYLYKHFNERLNIYQERKFPYIVKEINLLQNNNLLF